MRDQPSLRFSIANVAIVARRSFCVLMLFGLATSASANDEQIEFFEKKIRPVLVEHCYQCHASDSKKIRGGLLVDSREAIRKGGESGPGIVPANLDESLVLDALRHETFEMPPSGKLSDEVVANFEQWINDGAIDPREGKTTVTEAPAIDIAKGKEFWSFRPLRSLSPPSVKDATWPETDIDLFLLARREAEGVEHAPDADRHTLVRRVYLALVGLPPTPSQIREFADDPQPIDVAISKLVDRLLESKHFGERWGRHWLDVVRFAESSGGGRTLLFPDAWRYRDYVIESFNEDRPYDQFLREQIAGDLMPAGDWQTERRQITATTFLLLGPTNYELQDKDVLELDIVDEQIDTIGKAFMGMTIGCARCHDHKFDPIPMNDYYAMAGILKNTKSVIHSNVSAWNKRKLPVEPELDEKLTAHEAELAALEKELKVAKSKLKKTATKSISAKSLEGIVVDDKKATKTGEWTNSAVANSYVGEGYVHDRGNRGTLSEVRFTPELKPGKYEVRVSYSAGSNRSSRVKVTIIHAEGETAKYINQKKAATIGAFVSLGSYEFTDDEKRVGQGVVVSNDGAADGVVIADAAQFIPVDKAASSDAAVEQAADATQTVEQKAISESIKELEAKIAELKKKGLNRPTAMAPVDDENMADIHLAIRGVAANKGPVVPRGVLQVALNRKFPTISESESGRLPLADWVVDRTNPLTARVMVNRVWYWLFGEGLVRTVDNFGAMGEEPSHPELLDYLSRQFMEDDWSVKRLVKRIMLSHTYRLSSSEGHASAGAAKEADSANRLLWRMNRRRMDAESIRDSIMSVAGTLDLQMGGANIKSGTKIEYEYVFDSPRRSVYLPVFRNTLPQIFATFDFADPNIQGGKRTTSTIAPQALLLMNQPFVIEQSKAAANQLSQASERSVADRIELSYQQVLGRSPSERERTLAEKFIGTEDEVERWSLLYQTLFQSIDFRYVK